MIKRIEQKPGEGMSYPPPHNLDGQLVDPRPSYIQFLDLFNNFAFGLIFASFLWVWPFLWLAQSISDAILLNCGH